MCNRRLANDQRHPPDLACLTTNKTNANHNNNTTSIQAQPTGTPPTARPAHAPVLAGPCRSTGKATDANCPRQQWATRRDNANQQRTLQSKTCCMRSHAKPLKHQHNLRPYCMPSRVIRGRLQPNHRATEHPPEKPRTAQHAREPERTVHNNAATAPNNVRSTDRRAYRSVLLRYTARLRTQHPHPARGGSPSRTAPPHHACPRRPWKHLTT